MADFEEKLNAILSSPESMRQVAQLAQMLSAQNASEAPAGEEAQAPPPPPPQQSPPDGGSAMPDLSSLLDGLDMNTIARFLPLLQEMNRDGNDESTQLLYALKPFLKPERQNKVDSALRLARLFRVGKVFFKGLGERHV